jgi:hypothetical protein
MRPAAGLLAEDNRGDVAPAGGEQTIAREDSERA